MGYILGGIGLMMFFFLTVDILWTTLWVDKGAGPLTNWVTSAIWNILKQIGKERTLLKLAGPLILICILGLWVMIAWVSCFLIFNFFSNPLINTIDNRTLNSLDLFHFTGYTLFTLGNGEFAPAPGAMQILSGLVTGYGMIILSLGISYVLGVIDGVVQKRSVASDISALGESSEALLLTSFNGTHFYDLSSYMNSLSSELGLVTAKQKAYPLMNYYHIEDTQKSISYMLPILTDSLYVLKFGLSHDQEINKPIVIKSLSAIDDYLSSSTTESPQTQKTFKSPALPDYKTLKEGGLPLIDRDQFENLFEEVSHTRKHLNTIKKDSFGTKGED